MKVATNQIFLGFFLVFLRIEIGIDWLADPLGYYLIASGCFKFEKQFPGVSKKAGYMATAMIFISVPTVVVNPGERLEIGWQMYTVMLIALKLIVVYFLFALLKEIVDSLDNDALKERTGRTSRLYIGFTLLFLAYLSFQMNVSGSGWETMSVTLMMIVFIMDIVLLVLLRAIRRAVPDAGEDLDKSIEEVAD